MKIQVTIELSDEWLDSPFYNHSEIPAVWKRLTRAWIQEGIEGRGRVLAVEMVEEEVKDAHSM